MARHAPQHPPEFRDWDKRAADMLDEAKRMPPGPMRIEAVRKAKQLMKAAEMRRALSPPKQAES